MLLALLCFASPAYALSPPHHLYNASRRLVEMVGAPFYFLFCEGPRRMKAAWQAEVWGQEKPEKRGKFRYRLQAVPRMVGEEAKAAVDGATHSVDSAGRAAKELISIFLGD